MTNSSQIVIYTLEFAKIITVESFSIIFQANESLSKLKLSFFGMIVHKFL